MTYQYSPPGSGGGNTSERPRCWGDYHFHDSTSRECRNCAYQNSCGEQITRARNATRLAQNTLQAPGPAQTSYGQSYFANYAPPGVANPLPVVQHQTRVAQPVQSPRLPVPVPVQGTPSYGGGFGQPAVQAPPAQSVQQVAYPPLPVAPPVDNYGWLQDPMYYQIAAAPPPPRPQYQGENFATRVGKNIMLGMVEEFFKQCLLGVRQLILPPAPRQPTQPALPQAGRGPPSEGE